MSIQQNIEDRIPKDKLIHFCIGLLLSQLMYFSLWFLLLPVVIGTAKELYDKYIRKTGFNWWDLLVTTLGIVPVLVILILNKNPSSPVSEALTLVLQ